MQEKPIAENDLNICGKFLFEDKFNITNRGLVITGQIIEGTIERENFICIAHKVVKITGVDFGHRPNLSFVGLSLEMLDDNNVEARLNVLKGQVFMIVSNGTTPLHPKP